MLLLDLMAPNELKETIELLRKQLFESASVSGYCSERTIEISQRLDLYLTRYSQFKIENKR
ncbi:MAG: aspartyl-phosphate phosphatase Spo0E family protein [Bacillota bacterium]|nr:aspartyl-phosphate phosphatase Spo0E family protein [Bacillota bacterium]